LLLQSKAIKLNTASPFTWASGIKSPIYCDNRVTLSYPDVRKGIRDAFVEKIKSIYAEYDVIAGVATGAIAQGALVAEVLNKPFVYVRSSPKGHGLENLIEGKIEKGQRVIVIEDLVSTGGSSLKAVEALRIEGCEVLGMMAIFTYGFDMARVNFEKLNCRLDTLSNYEVLIDIALAENYINVGQLDTLKRWRIAPEKWML